MWVYAMDGHSPLTIIDVDVHVCSICGVWHIISFGNILHHK